MKALRRQGVNDRMVAAGREAEQKIVDKTLGRYIWALAHAAHVNDDGKDDNGNVPEGWSEEDQRWVRDIRKCKRYVPSYQAALQEIFVSRLRAEAAQAAPAKVELNIGTIVQVQPAPLKVIDVEVKD